ncbi:MAG: ATP-binding cassette domain-containing protein [Bacteroidales bacterium]|nr:ATP-binding cassette domain-containing protein [Bacteroidales bacterium]HOI31226.1 ATP-binding cassette domain-containing protein [Bacteroidales bacterium]
MTQREILQHSPQSLIEKYPFLSSFFEGQHWMTKFNPNQPLAELFSLIDEEQAEDHAFDMHDFLDQLMDFIAEMQAFIGKESFVVNKLTILPGTNKSGENEGFEKLEFEPRTITSIVGPTGSGKSRLLADIEWVAQGDTPTKRKILINEELPDNAWRFSGNRKLVAQLSQNMNFVMDLSVKDFLELHAKSRMVTDSGALINKIISYANELAGEKFSPDTAITALSGGQSRALMIADTALLSQSPVVLIDEIENAGIDRKKALEILTGEDKIVLMATHDPLLALMADQRIVIKKGGIHSVIKTSAEERALMAELEKADLKQQQIRTALRSGAVLQYKMNV